MEGGRAEGRGKTNRKLTRRREDAKRAGNAAGKTGLGIAALVHRQIGLANLGVLAGLRGKTTLAARSLPPGMKSYAR